MNLRLSAADPFGLLALAWLCMGLPACSAPTVVGDAEGPDDPPLDFYTEHLETRTALAKGATVRIINRWGDIRVRAANGDRVSLDASIQRIGEPFPARPELRIAEQTVGFGLEVLYPGASLEPRTGRVDLVVYVPAGLKASLETLDGTIELKKTAVDLSARTVSGNVQFINQGNVVVVSQTGDILARPVEPGWGALELSSQSGEVTVYLPGGGEFEVIARGTDHIESDWPVMPGAGGYLIKFGNQGEKRDRVLITSGSAIRVREVLLRPDAPADSFSGQGSGG